MANWQDRVQVLVCDVRGHNWAGAKQYAAQSSGVMLCLRCGLEDEGRHVPARRPLVRW